MTLVYIAGPFRGSSSWAVEQNIRAAEAWIIPLAARGLTPICVHSMYRHFDGTMTDKYWLDAALEIMLACDAVLRIGGASEGSELEVAAAGRVGIPVLYASLKDAPDAVAYQVKNAIEAKRHERNELSMDAHLIALAGG